MYEEEGKQILVSQSNATSGDTAAEALEVIREEQRSPTASSVRMVASKAAAEELKKDFMKCICKKHEEATKGQRMNAEQVERILHEKEMELRAEYDKILARETSLMKERFNFILVNEQTRASYMLREAHRERQEKITALQSQLQCKNLAALMYVICTERRRSKLEKMRIIRDYSKYIKVLQEILTEGQELILHLSRGYKTAARVDQEWREKMKRVVSEFLSFIYNFAGGSPESNQYFFDLPKLLQTEAPIDDNPNENPCDSDEEDEEEQQSVQELPRKKAWWEQLDEDRRPFVMFGDIGDFKPHERREVLKSVRDKKTAPRKWRHYVFNDMFFNATCPNMEVIKDSYVNRLPAPTKWECDQTPMPNGEHKELTMSAISRQSLNAGRQSIDYRGNMSSMLKIMTSNNAAVVNAKTELLGARDSMEITSTTKLRERASLRPAEEHPDPKGVVLDIGRKRQESVFDAGRAAEDAETEENILAKNKAKKDGEKEVEEDESVSVLGNDSLQKIQTHVPDVDHRINYERVCPMEKCQRLQVDSFMRSLPPYMRANPFTHFEQNFEEYEICTPEQLEMLKQRIESKRNKESEMNDDYEVSPTIEWVGRGVMTQTSDISMSLPPCTCHGPSPTPVSSNLVFNFQDLMPVKQAMDAIHRECLYDKRIDFDRFKLVGHDSRANLEEAPKKEFKLARYDEIRKILRKHPSLLDIFQANTR